MWGQETSSSRPTRSCFMATISWMYAYIYTIIHTYLRHPHPHPDTWHEYEQWFNDTSIRVIIWEHKRIEDVRTSTRKRRIKKHKSQTMKND